LPDHVSPDHVSPELPRRKPLGHATPPWVREGATFFVTICAASRGGAPLLRGGVAQALVASVQFLHRRADWFARLFMVMPDHVHALVAVPPDTTLALRIASWKGYTAKALGIEWQARFFDHRIRSDQSLEEKAAYIRMNPVRAGLVGESERWPYVLDAFAPYGSAGTPRPTR
jgi:REP element-mobilizing transposase RayT